MVEVPVYTHDCSFFQSSGSPTDYLEHYIFPFLLPALEEMLKEAKKEKCFEVLNLLINSNNHHLCLTSSRLSVL